ncbi:hypothetical protein NFJ02_02g73690 [Pycnococcus provasolii]
MRARILCIDPPPEFIRQGDTVELGRELKASACVVPSCKHVPQLLGVGVRELNRAAIEPSTVVGDYQFTTGRSRSLDHGTRRFGWLSGSGPTPAAPAPAAGSSNGTWFGIFLAISTSSRCVGKLMRFNQRTRHL